MKPQTNSIFTPVPAYPGDRILPLTETFEQDALQLTSARNATSVFYRLTAAGPSGRARH